MKISALILSLLFCATLSSCGDSKLHNDAQEASMAGGSAEDKLDITVTQDAATRGHATYLSSCSACHGAAGQGNGPAAAALSTKPRDHTNGAYMDKLSNRHIFNVIKMGGAMYGFPTMPAQPNLKDDEVKDLVAYIRTISNTYKAQ